MQFKSYFNQLKLKEKVLVFLMVPLILFLLTTFFEKYYIDNQQKKMSNQIYKIKQSIKKLKYKNKKVNSLSLMKHIDTIAIKFDILILNMSFEKRILNLKAIGSYQNIMNFLITLEDMMQIKLFQLSSDKKSITLDIKLRVKNIIIDKNKDYQIVQNIPNPFDKKKSRRQNGKLNLLAIIGDDVCVNDNWYTLGSKVGKYKISKISKFYIELINKNKIIKLELPKDD